MLIARRIAYVTRSTLGAAGVLFHETYNQLYPAADAELAALVRDKKLLGYHDIRTGNQPDSRLTKFLHVNLPRILPSARERFRVHFDLLSGYSAGQIEWHEFEQQVRRG